MKYYRIRIQNDACILIAAKSIADAFLANIMLANI